MGSSAPRVQVVVAHPDDETFACGSLLLHAAAANAVTAVTCATRGEAGEPPAGSGLGPAELARVREQELREAARLLGVSQVDVLDFADSGMNGPPGDGTLVGAPFEDVLAAVQRSIAGFSPDVVVTLDASDGHRDHACIREAATLAAQAAGVSRVYLHCLPRSLMQRWVDHMSQDRPEVEHLQQEVTSLGTPDELVTTVIDTREHLELRRTAIAAHASQTSPFETLPEDLRRGFLCTDHLQRVVPPWPGGPRETGLLGDAWERRPQG